MKITTCSVLLLDVAALLAGSLLTFYPASTRAQGGVTLWINRYNGPGNSTDDASAMAWGHDGNVFVTGDVWNGSNLDYATIKYSNTGIALWTNLYNGPGNSQDAAYAIAVDDTGNVFVTGESRSSNVNPS